MKKLRKPQNNKGNQNVMLYDGEVVVQGQCSGCTNTQNKCK
ncbi:MAG: hypothetical protein RR776_02180 [Niameybacter sp.]